MTRFMSGVAGVGGEARPERGVDPGGELVGVVGGGRGHGQDLARPRVEGHRRARPALEGLLHDGLQRRVDAQGEAGTVVRRLPLRLRDLDPAAVHDDAAEAVPPHELAVVTRLDPGLSHERPRGEALELRKLQLALRDLAHPAEGVGGGGGEGVRAQGHHLDAHLRELLAPRLERRHLREGGVGLHDHGTVGLAAGEPLADRGLAHAERRGEPGDQPVEVVRVLRGQDHAEGGAVAHQDVPLAVEEGAAGRGEGDEARAVVLRQVPEVACADHLEVPELDDERRQQDHRDGLHDGQAGLDDAAGPRRSSCRSGPAAGDRPGAKRRPPAERVQGRPRGEGEGRERRRRHREHGGQPLRRGSRPPRWPAAPRGRGRRCCRSGSGPRPFPPRSPRASFDSADSPSTRPPNSTSWTQPAAAPASMPCVSPPASAQ